ncbi:MAG: galactose mutarotase [Spirochaetales bacterium]|nr:galactose mutarotase [Spirochaetales bacterium]
MAITKSDFGLLDNNEIYRFTIKNSQGTEIQITNYGGIITSIKVKDKSDKFLDIVLGFETLDDYLSEHPYFGALIGRYGNRIAGAEFKLSGRKYRLFANNGENHLHGGKKGFDKVIWDYETRDNTLKLSYLSPDGEEGYPGNLKISVNYTLTENNELKISYEAVTDADTVLNLTNHSYFNLNGEGSGDILDHKLTLNSDYFIPTDSESIPTGKLKSVIGTPFDFTNSTAIGTRIEDKEEQLIFAGGYDHNFIINKSANNLKSVGKVESEKSGIKMDVYTTEPGVQFYTGNYLDESFKGKSGNYERRSGFCLETQHYPDSPHFPEFPTTILKKGEIFRSDTVYRFYI